MIVVKDFRKTGLPHGNIKTWSLVFDAATGELKVRISSTSQVGPTRFEEQPLSAFLAHTGNSGERRALRALLSRISSSIAGI